MAKYKIKDSVISVFIKNRSFTKKDGQIFDDLNGTDKDVIARYKAGFFDKIEESEVKTPQPKPISEIKFQIPQLKETPKEETPVVETPKAEAPKRKRKSKAKKKA